ncbi:MAG: flagellar basal body-associated FliL family protein [Sedimentisphaerales bacterium]
MADTDKKVADTDKKVTDTDKKAPDTDKKEVAKTEKDEKPQQAGAKIGILTWVIMAAVVVLLAGSGFVLGRLFAGSPSPETTKSSQENAPAEKSKAEKPKKEETKAEKKISDNLPAGPNDAWYYNELESVVVNPDEPGATRYVRVGLTLEISSGLTKEKAAKIILAKKPLLVNWLNLYFKSLTLSEMQNDRDMKRILSQICDSFNEILFPDAKPQIKKILIREFNIQ